MKQNLENLRPRAYSKTNRKKSADYVAIAKRCSWRLGDSTDNWRTATLATWRLADSLDTTNMLPTVIPYSQHTSQNNGLKIHIHTLSHSLSIDKRRSTPYRPVTNQSTLWLDQLNYLAVSWWRYRTIGGLVTLASCDRGPRRRLTVERWQSDDYWRWRPVRWRQRSVEAAATSEARMRFLVAVHHQLKVDRPAALVAVVEDVLRPRFALDVNQNTRWKLQNTQSE